MMSKRNLQDVISEKEESTEDTDISLQKRIKLEHDYKIKRVQRANEHLDITDHEVNKFLIIFHTLLDSVDLNEPFEETDRIITDITLQIVIKISSLLR